MKIVFKHFSNFILLIHINVFKTKMIDDIKTK